MKSKSSSLKAKNDIEYGKWCAALMFAFPLIGFVWYLADDTMKRNSYAKFYLKQALVFFIAAWIGSMIAGVLVFMTFFTIVMPILIMFTFQMAYWVYWIMGIVYALSEVKRELPIIGEFARKFKF